jgi:ubiquinone/menaquinone biosynthesis C-methylase UbiE
MTQPGMFLRAALAGAMWSWAGSVFAPARALRDAGIAPHPSLSSSVGPLPQPGLGRRFSRSSPRPGSFASDRRNAHLVVEFDRMAEAYDAVVWPFSEPIFDEALHCLRPLIRSDARVLDAGCGSGRELQRVARHVRQGEVVGIDLAAGMVQAAFESARAHGLTNVAFLECDVAELPAEFDGQFDVVYNSLAHHHYPEPAAAAIAIHRALRPGGIYAIIDAGPAWFALLASGISSVADPGWIGFHTPGSFEQLLIEAGFSSVAHAALLPGFQLVVAQKSALS